MSKTNQATTGYTYLTVDSAPPFDCSGSGAQQSQFTLQPLDTSATTVEHDTDADGCPDYKELGPDQMQGGLRDPFNPYDFFNPVDANQQVLVNDILKVVGQYFIDQGNPNYNADTDRTPLGPNPWNLGPPNGLQRVDDVLAVLKQYFHNCA